MKRMPKIEADVLETDVEWEKWGARDPYFGVLTHDRYRSSKMAADDYLAFFESGHGHVEAVLANCRRHFGEDFQPRRVLDFGCGVGRVLLPFAEICETVVGVDVSESMLAEARRNCARFGVNNAKLVRADDTLSTVEGPFDLVHSTIVFQHIESERGLDLIARLVALVVPGGGISIHVTYGRDHPDCRYGRPVPQQAETPRARPLYRRALSIVGGLVRARRPRASEPDVLPEAEADPLMMMYHYDLSRIAYILHSAGATGFAAELTDHGGELGVTVYARVGSKAAAARVDADQNTPKAR
jgi:SAM-dependent methyltransferase